MMNKFPKALSRIVGIIIVLAVLIMYIGPVNIMLSIAPGVDHEENIGTDFPFASKYLDVLGSNMHYIDEGEGEVVVLMHGNPTSSYLWRNIIPTLAANYRVIAADMIGMGKSDKPDIDYTLQDHIDYFTAFMDELGVKDVTLVMHDRGGGVGLSYFSDHQDNVKRVVALETVVKPFGADQMGALEQFIMDNLRKDGVGDKIIVKQNGFVEKMLPAFAGRKLTEVEMDHYRAPYLDEASRKPVRVRPQEIPIGGTPERNHKIVQKSFEALRDSDVPLLMLYAEPGAIFNEKTVAELRTDFPRATFQSIGPGLHFIQESQPTNIANAINEWLINN